MGGDKNKAEKYIKQLEEMDQFYGAKARLVLMPEGTNMADYWKNYIDKNGESCKALKELGVGYIFNDDFENAKISFEKAIALDKTQNIRLLDLARYYHMKVMQNRDVAETELPKSKIYIEQYLASVPEPIPPLHAYALGMLAKTEMFLGNNEEGQKIREEAKALDPYFSSAFAIPSLAIFEPPTKINHHFRSFFSPF
jgi:tetratricopeptide (TPR) repeat protein